MPFAEGVQVKEPESAAPAEIVWSSAGPSAVSWYRSMRTSALAALLYVSQRMVCGLSRSQSAYRSGESRAMCVAAFCAASSAVLPHAPWFGADDSGRTDRKPASRWPSFDAPDFSTVSKRYLIRRVPSGTAMRSPTSSQRSATFLAAADVAEIVAPAPSRKVTYTVLWSGFVSAAVRTRPP